VRAHSSGAQNYSLSAISGFGFTDLRQVRSSGATLPSVPETGTTLSLLGATVLALALLRRKLVVRKFAAGTPCNPVPLIQGNWVSVLRDCSQGSEASSTATATDSRFLIVAKFLESGIATQRIP
jgi:hypothetical protein